VSDDSERIPLHLVGRLKPRRSKFDSLLQLLPADDRSRSVLDAISRDFELVIGRSARARHRESGDEMGKNGFKHYCDKHYGDVRLVDKDGTESDHPSGVYWWGAGHDLPGSRVVIRSSRTAEERLVVPRNKHEGEQS